MKKIIAINDILYYVKGTQSVESVDVLGGEHWKIKWNSDTVVRNGDTYYFCQKVIEAEFSDI